MLSGDSGMNAVGRPFGWNETVSYFPEEARVDTSSPAEPTRARPRVEGEREREILEAVLRLLAEVGYDRLTFDAVAAEAHASKATLYRRWPGKADLVVDAAGLMVGVEADQVPDTGSLRSDLIGQACAKGGLTDERPISIFASLLCSMHRDPELMEAIRSRLIAPKVATSVAVFEAAQQRGEVGPDADLPTLARLLPAIAVHEALLMGHTVSADRLAELVDTIVLPACAATLRD
jgi:AcrR family transcriptional regulator